MMPVCSQVMLWLYRLCCSVPTTLTSNRNGAGQRADEVLGCGRSASKLVVGLIVSP